MPSCHGRAARQAGMSSRPQTPCAATGHGDVSDAVQGRRPGGRQVRCWSRCQGHQGCSLNSPPGGNSCAAGVWSSVFACPHIRYTRALRGEMSSRAGQCLVKPRFPAICLSVAELTEPGSRKAHEAGAGAAAANLACSPRLTAVWSPRPRRELSPLSRLPLPYQTNSVVGRSESEDRVRSLITDLEPKTASRPSFGRASRFLAARQRSTLPRAAHQ